MRARFMANAFQFYESIGVEMTEEDLRRFNDVTLKGLKAKLGDGSARALIFVLPSILSEPITDNFPNGE